jgi:hypothetical protein
MKKCEFCSKEISYFDMYCNDDCQEKAGKFYDLRDRFGKLFTFFDAIFVFLIPVGLFLGTLVGGLGDIMIVIGLVGLGIMLLLLPFPTESMIRKYQLQKAIKLCRIFGLILIVIGIIGAIIMFVI